MPEPKLDGILDAAEGHEAVLYVPPDSFELICRPVDGEPLDGCFYETDDDGEED